MHGVRYIKYFIKIPSCNSDMWFEYVGSELVLQKQEGELGGTYTHCV